MSLMTLETILCDYGEDCKTAPDWYGRHVADTRREAAKRGWTTAPGADYQGRVLVLDYCPEHTPSGTTS